METAKKTYHMACKEEKLAAGREADASVAPDQQKKLHEKTEKCKQDVQKVHKQPNVKHRNNLKYYSLLSSNQKTSFTEHLIHGNRYINVRQ